VLGRFTCVAQSIQICTAWCDVTAKYGACYFRRSRSRGKKSQSIGTANRPQSSSKDCRCHFECSVHLGFFYPPLDALFVHRHCLKLAHQRRYHMTPCYRLITERVIVDIDVVCQLQTMAMNEQCVKREDRRIQGVLSTRSGSGSPCSNFVDDSPFRLLCDFLPRLRDLPKIARPVLRRHIAPRSTDLDRLGHTCESAQHYQTIKPEVERADRSVIRRRQLEVPWSRKREGPSQKKSFNAATPVGECITPRPCLPRNEENYPLVKQRLLRCQQHDVLCESVWTTRRRWRHCTPTDDSDASPLRA